MSRYTSNGDFSRKAVAHRPESEATPSAGRDLNATAASSKGWTSQAACTGMDTNALFFSDHRVRRETRETCAGCPVQSDCLEYIMAVEAGADRKHRAGFYAGLSSEQRYQLARQRDGLPHSPKSRTHPLRPTAVTVV